jgi:hypothetical protein
MLVQFNDDFALDGTHLSPKYVPLLAAHLNSVSPSSSPAAPASSP